MNAINSTNSASQTSNLGANAGMVSAAQATAAQDMAAQTAMAEIARQVAMNDAKNALMKKGGDGLKSGI